MHTSPRHRRAGRSHRFATGTARLFVLFFGSFTAAAAIFLHAVAKLVTLALGQALAFAL